MLHPSSLMPNQQHQHSCAHGWWQWQPAGT
jgi:hypothetical protein